MHFLFLVADAGEDDDRQVRPDFAEKCDERDAVNLRHVQVDDDHFAVVIFQPGSSLESLGQGGAGMAFLFQVSGEKGGDGGVVVDDEEFSAIAVEKFHKVKKRRCV